MEVEIDSRQWMDLNNKLDRIATSTAELRNFVSSINLRFFDVANGLCPGGTGKLCN